MSDPLKQCSKCKRWLPANADYFHRRNGRKKTPWNSWCKECCIGNPGRPLATWEVAEGFKVCRSCNKKFPSTIDFFENYKRNKDGLGVTCRDCAKKARAEYRARNKEAIKSRKKAYYDSNWNKLAQKRKGNPDIAKRAKEWSSKNKEAIRLFTTRRRARKRSLPDTFTVAQWEQCLEYFSHCCAACGRPLNGLLHTAHADHFVPLSDPNCPGTVVSNMIPLCGGLDGCNNQKHNRPAAEWLESKFGTRKAKQILKRINAYFDHVRQQPT